MPESLCFPSGTKARQPHIAIVLILHMQPGCSTHARQCHLAFPPVLHMPPGFNFYPRQLPTASVLALQMQPSFSSLLRRHASRGRPSGMPARSAAESLQLPSPKTKLQPGWQSTGPKWRGRSGSCSGLRLSSRRQSWQPSAGCCCCRGSTPPGRRLLLIPMRVSACTFTLLAYDQYAFAFT